jgi:hypothetical protein
MKSQKELARQLERTVGGQDLWPRKSVAHWLRSHKCGFFPYSPAWAREFIQRRLGGALATPVGKLP